MKFQKNTLAAVILAALLAPTAVLAQDTTDSADTTDVSESFTGGDFTGDWKDNDMGLVADGFIAVAEDFAARDAALASLADQIEATDRNLTHAVFTRVSKAVYNADKKKIEDTVNPLVEGVNRLAEETLKVKDKANSTAQKVDDLEFTVNGAVEAVKAKVDQAQYDEDKKLIGGAFKEVKDAILTIQDDMDDVNGWFKSFDEHKANKEEVNAQVGALEDHIKATNTNLTHAINTKVSKAAYEADKEKINHAFLARDADLLSLKEHIEDTNTNLTHAINTKVSKAAYDADKKKIEDTVNPLVEGVNRLAEETLKVKDKANSTAQKVDDLEFTVNGAVEAVKTKAEKADVEALMGDVEESFEKIGELSAKNRELDAKKVNKAEYDADKKKIEDTVNPLVEGVNRLAEETLKVKDKANSTAQKVDDLEFTVNGAVEAVKTKADKTALEAKADKTALEAKADKTALEAKADKTALEAKADKTALEAKADKTALALKANIADVYSKTQADEKFVTQAQNIAVTQTVARNSQRIANLEGSVASLNTRVNAVEQKLKRGLATQAALSGLFQPYNVGKVNVTAAVGGYQSKSAVAVGMGYRVNEKFAAKAGVAVSLGNSSNTSYHVGVNYEF